MTPVPPNISAELERARDRHPGPVAVRIVCHLCGNRMIGGLHVEGPWHVLRTWATRADVKDIPDIEIINFPEEYLPVLPPHPLLAPGRPGEHRLEVGCKIHGLFVIDKRDVLAAFRSFQSQQMDKAKTLRTTEDQRQPARNAPQTAAQRIT